MRDKTNYAKGHGEQTRYLTKNWPKWKRRNKLEDLPRCVAALAEIHFLELSEEFKRYKEMTISEVNPSEKAKKKFEASVKAKAKARDELVTKYKNVAEFGQVVSAAEWALASLYNIGEAYKNSVERLLTAPIVQKIQGVKVPEDIKAQMKAQLRELATPSEESAIEAYRICVNKANELGVYTKWSVKALKRLQEMRPEEFPPSDERLGKVQFSDPLKVARNRLVIADGKSWRSLDAGAQPGGARPGDVKKKKKKKEEAKEEEQEEDSKGKGRRGRRR
ncbi:hypothetical protein ACFL6C_11735 [Myxococcota bacterium]